MPELAYEPASLAITGGTFVLYPYRLDYTPAALTVAGGEFALVPGYAGALDEAATPNLMRLDVYRSIVDGEGRPAAFLTSDWQKTMEAIEAAFRVQAQAITAIAAALAATRRAEAAASTAIGAAASVTAAQALLTSFPDPSAVLSASVTGSAATIRIAAHERVYSDGVRVAVNAGEIGGMALQIEYRVYYDDAARTGGAVAYMATTSTTEAAQIGNRHAVGVVTTPAEAAAPTTGSGTKPPGYVATEVDFR